MKAKVQHDLGET